MTHDWSGLEIPGAFRDKPLVLQASGDWACFTRPEMTSERVSYPIMTPTAAIGLLSAVMWKPEIRWVVDRIEVLAPVKWTNLRRNESGSAITADAVKRGYLDVDDVVQQRMTTMLRDVAYRVHANVWVHPDSRERDPAKWRDQFRRRVAKGQSFRTPYLGMREFHADIQPDDGREPVAWTEDLGVMLHSIQYDDRTGSETYDWFDARVEAGVMHVPRVGLMAKHSGGARP